MQHGLLTFGLTDAVEVSTLVGEVGVLRGRRADTSASETSVSGLHPFISQRSLFRITDSQH